MHGLFICKAAAVTKINTNVLSPAGNMWKTEHFWTFKISDGFCKSTQGFVLSRAPLVQLKKHYPFRIEKTSFSLICSALPTPIKRSSAHTLLTEFAMIFRRGGEHHCTGSPLLRAPQQLRWSGILPCSPVLTLNGRASPPGAVPSLHQWCAPKVVQAAVEQKGARREYW